MEIKYGEGKTEYGPGVEINLSGNEVAIAIDAFLTAHDIHINGARTIRVNGELCQKGRIYVDPSGQVREENKEWFGRGPDHSSKTCITCKHQPYPEDDYCYKCKKDNNYPNHKIKN